VEPPRISTSFFGAAVTPRNPVSIALFPPRRFRGHEFRKLAPPHWLLRDYRAGRVDDGGYSRMYSEHVLSAFSPGSLFDELVHVFGWNITLLCHCPPGEFCHRRLAAAFLEGVGMTVPEL
jgi:hypothetical protein